MAAECPSSRETGRGRKGGRPLARHATHVRGEPGAKPFVDDLLLGRGFVRSRAAPSLRSIESQPSTQGFVSSTPRGGEGGAGATRASPSPAPRALGLSPLDRPSFPPLSGALQPRGRRPQARRRARRAVCDEAGRRVPPLGVVGAEVSKGGRRAPPARHAAASPRPRLPSSPAPPGPRSRAGTGLGGRGRAARGEGSVSPGRPRRPPRSQRGGEPAGILGDAGAAAGRRARRRRRACFVSSRCASPRPPRLLPRPGSTSCRGPGAQVVGTRPRWGSMPRVSQRLCVTGQGHGRGDVSRAEVDQLSSQMARRGEDKSCAFRAAARPRSRPPPRVDQR